MAIPEGLLSLSRDGFTPAALEYLGHRLVNQPPLEQSERAFVVEVYRRLAEYAPNETARERFLSNAERVERATT